VALNDVMTDLQKASVSLQMGIQVRNKLVSAYQEVMGMQFRFYNLMLFIINNHPIPQSGHGWGKLTQFLVEDEYLVLVIFSHPGSVHPVNHLRVGVAHLLRDEVRVSTGS
jgi:hypothetical protein